MIENGIALRFANAADCADIAAIESQCFSEPWSSDAVRDFLRFDFNRILCAVINKRLAGYVSFTFIPDEIEIQNVAVAKDLRRKGIADAILNTLCVYASDNSCAKISLEVRASNLTAISLYQKHSFFRSDVRKNFYRHPTENAFVMIKEFNHQKT